MNFVKCTGSLKFNSMLVCVSPGIKPIISTWPLVISLPQTCQLSIDEIVQS